jgi:hypothetical protein
LLEGIEHAAQPIGGLEQRDRARLGHQPNSRGEQNVGFEFPQARLCCTEELAILLPRASAMALRNVRGNRRRSATNLTGQAECLLAPAGEKWELGIGS